MSHKIHPFSFRIGTIFSWKSKWLNKKEYSRYLKQDWDLRNFIKKKLSNAGVKEILIERSANLINIIICSSRPGIVIGRGGTGIEELKIAVEAMLKPPKQKLPTGQAKIEVKLEIQEVKSPETHAQLVAQNIASELERRIPYRRTLKRALDRVSQEKVVKGVKILLSGRLNGAEIARSEWLSYGKIPLGTLRADIDFAESCSYTTYGIVGVKVWIYKGEVFEKNANTQESKTS